MSAEQTRGTINQLDKDIANLGSKSADYAKKAAAARGRITQIMQSISKNTSLSTLKTKQSQINRYENEANKAADNKADTDKKIADKQKKRSEAQVKLQHEEMLERKKNEKIQTAIQRNYEKRISELTERLSYQTIASTSTHFYEERMEEYDVFISHAWEDKETFVNEFVDELTALEIKVWYDNQRITWGDSMRAKIDNGLAKSKFGVIIISPNYIADGKYWTKAELDGLVQLESVNGKIILPIWHNITKKEVMAYSSIIAGRLAMTTATMTPKEIAYELMKLLNSTDMENQINDQA